MRCVNYETIQSTITVNDAEKINTYGIQAISYDNNGQINDADIIYDISINKNYVDEIVFILIKNEVSLIHFRDVIYDLIGVLWFMV